jgi:hypothetical protein
VQSATIEEAAGGLTTLMIKNDTMHVQKFFFLLNYLDFCIIPRTTLATFKYFEAYYRQLGFDKESNTYLMNEDYFLNRTFDYDPTKYKIPLKSHRIWVTSPNNPREMLDVLVDEDLQAKLSQTNKILDQALEKDPYNYDKDGN